MDARANRFRILVAAIRWRAGISIATFLVAVASFASAAGSPLYLGSAEDSALRSVLSAASTPEKGLTLTSNLRVFGTEPSPPVQRVQDAASRLRTYGLARWFGSPITTTQISGSLPAAPDSYQVQLVSRDQACAHLAFSAGGCPSSRGEVALSDRTSIQLHVGLNGTIVFQLAGKPALTLTVAGIYVPGDSTAPYWWNVPFFNFAPSIPTLTGETPFFLDALFVTPATTDALPISAAAPTVTSEIPLSSRQVEQPEIQSVLMGLGDYSSAIGARDDVVLSSGLVALLARASRDDQLMVQIAAATGPQLSLLALLVLYGIVSRSSETREAEVALAKLHGFRFRGVLAVGLLEPLALITLAVPFGLLLAWLMVRALVGSLFGPETSVAPDVATVLALATAYAAAAVAAIVGARELMTRPLSEQLRSSRTIRSGRWTAALDLVAIVLALAGLFELVTGGTQRGSQADPLALAAPGLLAIAAAIAVMRLLPHVCRIGVARTANSTMVALFLALRHVSRRPSTIRTLVVLAIGASLSTFSVAGWTVADQNRMAVANFKTGANRVLTVTTPKGAQLQDLVRKADPGGQLAMAAISYTTQGGTLMAVDTSRLATVPAWPTGLAPVSPREIANWLSQSVATTVTLRGLAVMLTIAGNEQEAGSVGLHLTVADSSARTSVVDLGSMIRGPHDYTAALPPTCASGCRLVALTPSWSPPPGPSGNPFANYYQIDTITLALSRVLTGASLAGPWQLIDASLGDPKRWIGNSFAVAVSSAPGTPGSLLLTFDERRTFLPQPSVQLQDAAQAVPAVVTPDLVAFNGGGIASQVSVDGLDGQSVSLNGRYQVPALPRIGSSGALVDLSRILRATNGPLARDAVEQVWLSRSASDSLINALRVEGVSVQKVDSAATLKHVLDASGLSLAYELLAFAGVVSALLTLGAAVFNILITAQRRAQEISVLEAMGIWGSTLGRSLFAEHMLVLGAGVMVGVVAGSVSAAITLPAIPELSGDVVQPLQYALPAVPILGFAAALLVALALVTGICVVWTRRLAVPARLRMALM